MLFTVILYIFVIVMTYKKTIIEQQILFQLKYMNTSRPFYANI